MALLAPFSLLFADSLVLSASQVNYHFNKSSSYLNSAAYFGDNAAAYELYQTSGNINWLKKAAKLGHAEAAWQLYRLDYSSSKSKGVDTNKKSNVWFDLAFKNNHPGAMIKQLETLVIAQSWKLASRQIFKIDQKFIDFPNTKIEVNLLDELTQTIELGVAINQIVLPGAYKKSIQKIKTQLSNLQQNKQSIFEQPGSLINFKPSCEVKVLVIANKQDSISQTERNINEFHSILPNSKTKICFSSVIVNYQLNALCQKSKNGLLSCDPSGIKTLLKEKAITQNVDLSDPKLRLLVVANEGKANSRGPVIFMDKNDTAQVLLHEIGHWLNLYDEYQLRPAQQNIYCNETYPRRLGENLIIAPVNYNVETLQTSFQLTLWPVETCKGTKNQAYKWIPELSPMEYLDVQLTPAMKQFYNEPKLNPFHTDLETFFE